MIKVTTIFLASLVVVVLAGASHAQLFIENFDAYGGGTLLRNVQAGAGPWWNAGGANEGNNNAPIKVQAGKGVGGSNAASSAIVSEGSSNTNIPASAFVDGRLTVQVDVDVSGRGNAGGNADIDFALSTLHTRNQGSSGTDDNFFSVRMRNISDFAIQNMVGGSHDFLRVRQIDGELSMGVEGHIMDGHNIYNAVSAGWVQIKIEVDTNKRTAGIFLRDIDDTTGAAIGPWSGGYWKTTSAGAMGANTGFFWEQEGIDIEIVSLMSQGSGGSTSYYDNLVIGAGGGTASFAGDFDGDGDVDGDDFLAWQNGFPTSSGAAKTSGDADGDGDVDGDDFLIWQNTFPYPAALAKTPEPASLGLLVLGGLMMLRRRRT